MKTNRLFVLLVLLILTLTACSSPIEENMSREVESFSAVTQDGEKVNLPEDLEGRYWIADFIFTNCETVCSPMTGNMSRLQQALKEENMGDVPLRSFTVDPQNDTEDELKAFADPYNPDYEQWSFLTGYSFNEIKELSIKSFQSPLKKLEDSEQFAHGTSFYLVTPKGEVIKSYSGLKADSTEQILQDLKTLRE
ncbi:SCO family protein [Halobacillus fulvus]|nr:SCO family protein [Halobacillus fulvus]